MYLIVFALLIFPSVIAFRSIHSSSRFTHTITPNLPNHAPTKTSVSAGGDLSIDECGKCPKAPKCSGEYLTQGCDGTGKIQGGIGTVLTWWPIKVFRPCPSYLAAGYQYKREGQTMDQVLFSEPSTKMKEKMEELRKQEEAMRLVKVVERQAVLDEQMLSEEEKFLTQKFPEKKE